MGVIAGHQSGKTSFGPRWLHREINARGPGDYLAVSSTYDLYTLKMLPEILGYFVRSLGGWEYHSNMRVLSGPRGTRIILRSAASEGGLEAATAKAAWLDEAGQDDFEIGAWEAVQRRLSIARGRILITTTPYNLGWLKSQVFDRWKGGDKDYDVIQFKSKDNPAFPDDEYDRLKAMLPPWKFAMFCDGEFARPAGLIYSDYIDSYSTLLPVYQDTGGGVPLRYEKEGTGHLVRPFPIPPTWLRDLGVDFGPVNEARLWVAREPGTGCQYAYREAIGGGLAGPEYAKEVLEYSEPLCLKLGGAATEEQKRREWAQAGLAVAKPFITDPEAGIDHLIGLFRQNRIFVFDTLTRLRSELTTYSRELDDSGEPTAKIEHKDKFHMLDALRAVASGIPQRVPKARQSAELDAASRKPSDIRKIAESLRPKETDEYR